MKRGFEEQMTKMRGEVSKIQEEKVHLMGLEQRLRQEFQTQVIVVSEAIVMAVIAARVAFAFKMTMCARDMTMILGSSGANVERGAQDQVGDAAGATAHAASSCACDGDEWRRMASFSCALFYEGKSSRGRTATGTQWRTCDGASSAYTYMRLSALRPRLRVIS